MAVPDSSKQVCLFVILVTSTPECMWIIFLLIRILIHFRVFVKLNLLIKLLLVLKGQYQTFKSTLK